jgi:hypothetical protein
MEDDAKNDITASNIPVPGSTPTRIPASIPAAGIVLPEETPDVGLLRPVSSGAPATPAPPIPYPSTTPANDSAMQNDIQKILGSIKLPERRGTQTPTAPKQEITVAPIEQHLETPAQSTTTPERPIVTPVHTLKDDIQHVVREEKMSLVRAASLEEDRKLREEEDAKQISPGDVQRKKRIGGVIFATLLLTALGLAALFGVMLVANQQAGTPSIQENTLVFAEQSLILPLDGVTSSSLKQQVSQLRASQVGSLGSITRIIPAVATTTPNGTQTRPATTQEFLRALDTSAPDALLRALGTEFFFGLHSADENAPLFVIPVVSYDNAFAGMLAWEQSLNTELSPIFTPLPVYQTDADGIPHVRAFADAVIRNYDTRTLTDDNSTIQLYYSFPSPKILVIAESPYTFAEVIARLRAQRRL